MLIALNKHMDIMDVSSAGITIDLNRTNQTVEAHAGHLMQNKAEAEEPNEDDSKIDEAAPIGQSTVNNEPSAAAAIPSRFSLADDSTPMSNSSASTTDSTIPSRSALTDDSTHMSNPGASITNSAIAIRPAASDNSALFTGVAANKPAIPSKSALAIPIAATVSGDQTEPVAARQTMDVDMTPSAPPFVATGSAPDEIAP
ncbi:hypothetical protein J132_09811 [Termitomyces sp. J132]|nr:hypothetical protein J132_09811 [Termitomyces sp. J132]